MLGLEGLFGVAFSRPWVLAALALLPLYGWLRWRILRRAAVAFAPLQYPPSAQARGWAGAWRWAELLAELLVLATVLVALAGPYRSTEVELLEGEGIDVILALDVSLSMRAEDFQPNRLAVLRQVAGEFVARASGHRLGLVIFARDAYVQSPLTTDPVIVQELLEGVTVYAVSRSESGGTAVGDALLVASERLEASRVEGRDQAVILITDGESNQGIDPVLAARYLRERGTRLYAIGVGSETAVTVPFEGKLVGGDRPYRTVLDDRQLRAMAEAADGRYWRATDAGALEAIFGELSRLESAPFERRTLERREGEAPKLALAAVVLFALLLGVGTRLRRPLA